MSVAERMRVAGLAADKSRRAALSRLLYSPFLRWRYGAPVADQLLIVPQDLRTADPSFWHEIVLDHFGLAGTVAALDGHSPFDVRPPNLAWAHSLHGFGWLRHLGASGNPEARQLACRLAVEWTLRNRRSENGFTWLPQVAARRVISWISHSNVLLDDANPRTYDIIANSLGAQLVRLSAEWRDTPGGYPRLLVLLALVLADLAIAGHDRRLVEAERAFAAELDRQVLADGGHISRNPRTLVELMLDLLPLRQCFAARGRALPPGMSEAMQRMLTMLRYLRLGDGRLARFNGMGVATSASLATVLAYDEQPYAKLENAAASGYVRMDRGATVILVDAGAPPPLEYAGEAYAGCLSFEMSSGTELLFVNGGAPAPVDAAWRAMARATASHNTLCVADTSSSRLVRHKRLEAMIGSPPIREPDRVAFKLVTSNDAVIVAAHHDGYAKRFGLKHARRIALSNDGNRVEGVDRLAGPHGALRLTRDLPFAVHFQLHPDVACERGAAPNSAELTLHNGDVWVFMFEGATLAIEDGTFYADSTGPARSLQLVARGITSGETEVKWHIAKQLEMPPDPPEDNAPPSPPAGTQTDAAPPAEPPPSTPSEPDAAAESEPDPAPKPDPAAEGAASTDSVATASTLDSPTPVPQAVSEPEPQPAAEPSPPQDDAAGSAPAQPTDKNAKEET